VRHCEVCSCESSGACAMHDAIHRTWAGTMLHSVALLIIYHVQTAEFKVGLHRLMELVGQKRA
jgi:hypothetical protein